MLPVDVEGLIVAGRSRRPGRRDGCSRRGFFHPAAARAACRPRRRIQAVERAESARRPVRFRQTVGDDWEQAQAQHEEHICSYAAPAVIYVLLFCTKLQYPHQ